MAKVFLRLLVKKTCPDRPPRDDDIIQSTIVLPQVSKFAFQVIDNGRIAVVDFFVITWLKSII